MIRARALILFCTLLAGACFQSPAEEALYRCDSEEQCGEGLVCDDGVCCRLGGTPSCPTRVPDAGCPDGGPAFTAWPDLDGDGFGNTLEPRTLCGLPVLSRYSTFEGDCLDTPNLGENTFPDAGELCDGLDNDCDGVPDDGLPTQGYFQDSDNDGYGDPASPRNFCAPPPGWLASSNDCAPSDGNVHPGAPEVCNRVDDDCDNTVDNLSGVQPDCALSSKKGICAEGRQGCQNGQVVCTQTNQPRTSELCNGLDDTCDGTVDEQPGCGGPPDLLSGTGITQGAQNLGKALNGGFTVNGCLKDYAGSSPETWVSPSWQGQGSNSHLFYAQKSSGNWDLSKPGVKLRIRLSLTMFKQDNTPWAAIGQPVLYLCSPGGGYARIVHLKNGANVPWFTASGTYEAVIPLNGSDPDWILGSGGTANFASISRVELLLQPNANGDGGVPSFNIQFQKLGFE